ncbi:MAG: hypothetical protein J6C96_07815 [Oscillospiraceae bacterium]|nr:hypothetical protein [Oscillospiraceae bacterium]
MNMKLSYRDKVIFIVVMVIVVLIAGFFIFIKPKFGELDTAKYNLATKQQEKTDIDTKIGTLPGIIDSIKETAKEVGELQDNFIPEQHPYLNEMYLRDMLNKFNLEYKSINTNYTTASEIKRYVVTPKNILAYQAKMDADLYQELPQEVYDKYNNVVREAYPNAIIGVTTVTVVFKSDNQLRKMYDVMDAISDHDKTIILNTISTGEAPEDGGDREISCNLTMYSVHPMNVEKVLEETAEVKYDEQATTEETQPAA